jgi:hypothetical protein
MKLSLPRIILVILAIIFLAFAMIVSAGAYGAYPKPLDTAGKRSDSILIYKKILNRSYKIGLYPDAEQKVVFFTVKGAEGKVYQLYLFDLDGNLVKQLEIRNKQTSFISEMERGMYSFDVFCDDDKIGNGQIAFR